jgi:hypothetical protein
MDLPELPDDLAELERRLAGRPRAEPGPGCRGRVLDAVRRESGRNPAGSGAWRLAAAVAAAVLFGANLALSVGNDTSWHPAPGNGTADLEAGAGGVRRLFPDMPEREVYRHALLLQAGARLPLQPDPRPAPGDLRSRKERERRELRGTGYEE